jgi:hypothetical protein
MRITIDVDPTVPTASVTGPVSSPGATIGQAPIQPAAHAPALDAGASVAAALGEGISAPPPQATNAGVTAEASATTPTHPDSFGLTTDTGLGNGALNAGSARA